MEALRLFCRVLLLSLTSFLIRLSGLYEWKGIYSLTKENLKRRTLLGWWRLGELEKSFLLPVPATLIQGLTTAVYYSSDVPLFVYYYYSYQPAQREFAIGRVH